MRDAAQGDDLVAALGTRTAVLMRGHGCVVTGADVRQAVFAAVYLERNAALLATALGLGEVRSLSVAETQREGSDDDNQEAVVGQKIGADAAAAESFEARFGDHHCDHHARAQPAKLRHVRRKIR